MEIAAGRASLPFEIVENLDVACGYERSFKMLHDKLLANRYLLGIRTGDVPRDKLLDACRRLGMPETYVESFEADLADANLVFMGFEDNEASCMYKVYLEFWEKVKKDLQTKRDKKEPVLLHLGFKWNTEDSTRRTIARYTCYPVLSVKEILKRIASIYAGHEDPTSREVTESMIQSAAKRSGDTSFIYVEVSEPNNPRVSFDINLYKANVRLSEVSSMLSKVRQHYAISAQQFGRLYELVGDKLLGHLSGGIDREGKDFFTVYYEVTLNE